MRNCAKCAGRISRPDYESRSVQNLQEEFEDYTMNVKACEECGRISRQDYECGNVGRLQEEFQDQK